MWTRPNFHFKTRWDASSELSPSSTPKHLCYDLFLNHICSSFLSILVCSAICLFIRRPILVFPYCMYMFIANEGFFIHKSCLIVNSKACDDIQLNILDIKAWFDCWYTAIINRQNFYDNYRVFFLSVCA